MKKVLSAEQPNAGAGAQRGCGIPTAPNCCFEQKVAWNNLWESPLICMTHLYKYLYYLLPEGDWVISQLFSFWIF